MTIFNGKTHYKWPFSIAMLNYQRVWSIQKTNGNADEAEHDDANAGNDGGVVMMAMLAMLAMILSSNSSCNNVNE